MLKSKSMPKVVDHAARRAELAAAVWSITADRGLGAASLREVAAEAGWSLGALRHYFASRDELLRFAFGVAAERGRERIVRAATSGAPTRAGLRRSLEEMLPLDAERATECRVWLAFVVGADLASALAAERERAYAELLDELARQLDGLTRFGHSPERTARLLWAAVEGIALQGVAAPAVMTPARQQAALEEQLDLLLAGARPGGTTPPRWG